MIKSIPDATYLGVTYAVVLFLWALQPDLRAVQAQDAEVGQPAIQYFSPQTYGAPNQNFGLAQGADGVMYFANRSGVLEYDGAMWQLSRAPNDRTVWVVVPVPGGPVLAAGDGFIAELGGIGQEDMVSIRMVDGEVRSGVVHDFTAYFSGAKAIHTWRPGEGITQWKQGSTFGIWVRATVMPLPDRLLRSCLASKAWVAKSSSRPTKLQRQTLVLIRHFQLARLPFLTVQVLLIQMETN